MPTTEQKLNDYYWTKSQWQLLNKSGKKKFKPSLEAWAELCSRLKNRYVLCEQPLNETHKVTPHNVNAVCEWGP